MVLVLLCLGLGVVVVLAWLLRRALAAFRRLESTMSASQAAAIDQAMAVLAAQRDSSVAASVDAVVSLAADKLGSHLALGTQHVELRTTAIQDQLAGMGHEIRRVNTLVTTLQKERAEQFGQLVSGLADHARQSGELAQGTQALRDALSSPKARGQWGERMAEDVLRLAGLVEGVNYRKQQGVPGGTIPDFTFLLPHGWVLHMDVKFPADNYLRSVAATTEVERAAAGTAFVRDVRARIKELGGRGYVRSGETLDYVLAFIPNEAVYGFVHSQDPALVDDALRQRVILCSPFTLFAVLAVIRQSVEHFAVERTSNEILSVLGGFFSQWEKFAESLDGLGRKLEATSRAYEDVSGTRRRQLQRSLDRVDDLRSRRVVSPEDTSDPQPLRAVVG